MEEEENILEKEKSQKNSRYSDITQIAACNVDRIFSRYIFPNQSISAEASRITGLTVVDSLNLFKQVVPGLASYSQSFLVNNLLGQEYESHNAVHDARLLLKLITDKGNIFNYLDDLAFSPNYPDQYHLQLCNLKTYSKEINEKVISKAMALKAAKSNLKLCHLKMSIDRGGKMGLKALLSEKSVKTGDARVTKNKKILQRIFEYFEKQ
ncbi:unnamed protein product [Mytilus coruscus]|uniref:PML C-terminal domain-containing protein n=1 Tax=Mytilus coruscus TaxID=42192 RepID=A0A6J8A9H4_MYTCO|nr:unnamed protein product [Mytilus coruscus]